MFLGRYVVKSGAHRRGSRSPTRTPARSGAWRAGPNAGLPPTGARYLHLSLPHCRNGTLARRNLSNSHFIYITRPMARVFRELASTCRGASGPRQAPEKTKAAGSSSCSYFGEPDASYVYTVPTGTCVPCVPQRAIRQDRRLLTPSTNIMIAAYYAQSPCIFTTLPFLALKQYLQILVSSETYAVYLIDQSPPWWWFPNGPTPCRPSATIPLT